MARLPPRDGRGGGEGGELVLVVVGEREERELGDPRKGVSVEVEQLLVDEGAAEKLANVAEVRCSRLPVGSCGARRKTSTGGLSRLRALLFDCRAQDLREVLYVDFGGSQVVVKLLEGIFESDCFS